MHYFRPGVWTINPKPTLYQPFRLLEGIPVPSYTKLPGPLKGYRYFPKVAKLVRKAQLGSFDAQADTRSAL